MMDTKRMVSIVVPIYNTEQYLRECLESIRNQTYEDIEVILVNDGSRDHSEEICEEYCSIDVRFHLVNKENEGLGFARNTGLEHAKGKYVFFIDSDDYLDNNAISVLVKYAIKYNADVVIGNYQAVTEKGKKRPYYGYDQKFAIFENEEIKNALAPRLFGNLPQTKDSVTMQAAGSMYSLSIIREHDIRFCSEREFSSEDLFFNLDYICYAKSVCVIPDKVCCYRINPKSLSHCYRPDRYELKRNCYIYGCEKLKKFGIYEKAKLRIMKYYINGIRSCISQEAPRVSNKKISDCANRIFQICNDEYLKQIMIEYPVKQLNLPQRLFLWMIRNNCVYLLLLFAQIGMLS